MPTTRGLPQKTKGGLCRSGVTPETEAEDGAPSLREQTLEDFLQEMGLAEELELEPNNGNGPPSLTYLKQHFKTKSAIIRYLHEQGHPTKVIAKHLNLRYQHVRNVLTTQLKRGPNELPTIPNPVHENSTTTNNAATTDEDGDGDGWISPGLDKF